MIDEILAYNGEYFHEKSLRNAYIIFKCEEFSLENDLIAVEASFNSLSVSDIFLKLKNSEKLYRVLIDKNLITKFTKTNSTTLYQFELFLDKVNYDFPKPSSIHTGLDISMYIFSDYKKRKNELKILQNNLTDSLANIWLELEHQSSHNDYSEKTTMLYCENIFNWEEAKSREEFILNFYDQVSEQPSSNDSRDLSEPTFDELDDIEDEFSELNLEEFSEYLNDQKEEELESYYESLLAKYDLTYIYELKHYYFVGLGVLLANVDNEFSLSEKNLIENYLLDELDLKKTKKIIKDIESKFNLNNLTMSSLMVDVRDSLYTFDKNNLIEKLYALVTVDGKASKEELLFLDKICEYLNIDFEFVKDIKTSQLLNVEVESAGAFYSMLDIDFNSSLNKQLQQAEDQLYLWNSRLNTIIDPKKRANAQLLIDKYSDFIKDMKSSNKNKKGSDKISKFKPSEVNFPLPPKHSDPRVNKKRKEYPRHYARWSISEEEALKKMFSEGYTVTKIAKILQRVEDAIEKKLEKLKLI